MARYTLILGTRNWSSWSLRPYLALSATGQPFDETLIALRRDDSSAAILAQSPAGKVPILKIEEDGRVTTLWDSLAICETIAERHPEAGLWPDDARTRALARSYAAEMHAGFADLRTQLGMDFVRRLPLPDLTDATRRQIARIQEAWSEALAHHKGGFLFGRFSIADAMYAPVVSRFTTYGVAVPPLLQAYMDRIWAMPAMQAWRRAAEREVAEGRG